MNEPTDFSCHESWMTLFSLVKKLPIRPIPDKVLLSFGTNHIRCINTHSKHNTHMHATNIPNQLAHRTINWNSSNQFSIPTVNMIHFSSMSQCYVQWWRRRTFLPNKKNWKYTNTDSTLYRPNIFHSVSATNYFGRDAIEILIANQSKFIDHWFGTEVEHWASPNLQETISQTLSEKEQNNRDNHPVNTTETMSRITPVASPSPPLRSASRHQTSPQLKSNFSDLSIHRKSSEPICESPTDFQLLTTKSTDAYQDEEQFPANCKKQCISLLLFFVGIQQSAHWTRQNEKKEILSGKQEERHHVLLVCSARIAFDSFSLCLFRSS